MTKNREQPTKGLAHNSPCLSHFVHPCRIAGNPRVTSEERLSAQFLSGRNHKKFINYFIHVGASCALRASGKMLVFTTNTKINCSRKRNHTTKGRPQIKKPYHSRGLKSRTALSQGCFHTTRAAYLCQTGGGFLKSPAVNKRK